MKRLIASLGIWIALCGTGLASTYIAQTGINTASGNNNNAVPVPPATVDGDLLIFCFELDSTTGTLPAGWTTLDSVTNTLWMRCAKRVASSEPSTYSPTWTGNSVSNGMIIDIKSTDGTTPVVDVHTITGGGAAPASVTTTVDNDLIVVPILNNTGNTGLVSSTYQPLGITINQQFRSLLYGSQKTAGATSWLPSSITFSGAGTVLAATIAVESNTTTSANFVGVGTDSYNSGSASSVSPGYPSNASAGDALFAGITQSGSSGATITAPTVPDIQWRELPTAANGAYNTLNHASPQSVTVSPLTKVGDLLLAQIYNSNTTTPPAPTGGENSWTAVTNGTCTFLSPNKFGFYSKIATSGDIGQTQSWASSSGAVNVVVMSFYSASGASVAVDTASNSCGTPGGATHSATAITFSHANSLAIVAAADDNTVTMPTSPTGITTVYQDGTLGILNASIYFQAASGTSATPTFTSAGPDWAVVQVGLTTSGAANLTWTHQATVASEGGTAQEDVYSIVEPSTGIITSAATFTFGSNPSASDGQIVDFSYLNATTPSDSSNTLRNEGMTTAAEASLPNPTSQDDLVVIFNGYQNCTPPNGTNSLIWPQDIQGGGRSSVYYTTPDYASTTQRIDQCGNAYASVAVGLDGLALTNPSAALRIQQQIEEIFSLAPAPAPPTPPRASYQDFISRIDPNWILATK